jgi:hypothetical protein
MSEAIVPAPAVCHYGMQWDEFNFACTVKQTFVFVTIFAEV